MSSNRPDVDRVIRTFFKITMLTEAFTWCGLLIALAFKYVINGWAFGVTVFGWIHGVVWLAVVLAILVSTIRFRWPIWITVVGLAMSMLPFLTVPFEIWMSRTDRLRRRPRGGATGTDTSDSDAHASLA